MRFLGFLLLTFSVVSAEPLRVFIRSGEKTHGPGCHDYPAFLKDWTELLNERGAKATGGNGFPTAAQLAETDVVILHAAEAGNIHGEDRENFEAYLKRGGGVVAIHGGAVSRDHDWFKGVIGGSWKFGMTKFLEGEMSLYFTDRENPITRGASNFDLDDEIYYDMDILPEAKVLAAAYTPKSKSGEVGDPRRVNVYDIQPQMWTYETGDRRAFVCIPGHLYENFSHTSLQTILLRGIAWAGKADDADLLLKDTDAVAESLRYPVGGPTRPEDAAGKIKVHPEFDLSLVAAEPLINKALNLDWDAKGRMWVVESPEYPNGLRRSNAEVWKDSGSVRPGVYDREPLDRISILTDADGDGRMDGKTVFADKLELASGFVLHENGVIVAAAPDIWFIEDTDGDGTGDKRTKLYTGLGNRDTHAVINNLRWGLDGWIYATHGYSAGNVKCLGAPEKPEVGIGSGVVRFRPDGTEIEMVSSKRGNTWGLCMTSDGQTFWTQPTSGTVFYHTVLPEYVLAKGKIPGTDSFHGMITGQRTFPLMKWEQLAYVQIDHVGSYTAASGCAVYEGGAWPEKWNYSYFTGEPTVNLVSHYFVKPDGVTYTTEKEKGREETEFILSSDLWFRPIETRVGPDGALYVIDFYNQAVIHNDTRGPQHNPATAAVRPDRDHYFGRVWRIQHKDAKQIEVPVIDRKNPQSIEAAMDSPNAHTRMTAIRLAREAGNMFEVDTGSEALSTYETHKNPATAAQREKLIRAFVAAEDDWTRSALVAAAAGRDMDVITDCLASPAAGRLAALVESLLAPALGENPAASARKLVIAVADNMEFALAENLRTAILTAIVARKSVRPELDKELADSLRLLLDHPSTGSLVLPLVARWDMEGKMKEAVGKRIAALSATLADTTAPEAARIAAARALLSLGTDESVASALWILRKADEPRGLQTAVLAALGEAGFSRKLAEVFPEISPGIRGAAFDEILKRPASALAFLDKVAAGELDPALVGPAGVARLLNHPDGKVAERAGETRDKLTPGANDRDAVIAKFLPEVSKPGDVANGSLMFTAACATCHKFGDVGDTEVGPALTGMGTHAASELLVHIIDPNREVDPSFWQWNITTRNGETFAGTIVSENSATLTLRDQGGDREIRKPDIARRENTRRSLMPEGFEALGAENIRDIIAYMAAADADRLGAEGERKAPEIKDLPADSTSATGQRFLEPREEDGTIRVLLVGSGTSHHFPRDFISTDRDTLLESGADVIGTMNLAEALELLPAADVLVFSGNHDQWGAPEFQKALHAFADAGKGILLLHAATWAHPWKGYNERFVTGGTKAHGKGTVAADSIRPAQHPILKEVPESFTIRDESYHFSFFAKDGHTTLIENRPDGKSPGSHPALWIVDDPKARIVCYTHGHDAESHANPVYRTLITNAVNWLGERK